MTLMSINYIIKELRILLQLSLSIFQEDGTITMEEATDKNSRIGAYSYIGDDGKVYTVKYEVSPHSSHLDF